MDPPTLVPSFDFDHSSFWAPCFATFGHFSTFHGIACYHLACSRGWLQHRSKVICSRDWYILSCQSPINEHLPVEIKGTIKKQWRDQFNKCCRFCSPLWYALGWPSTGVSASWEGAFSACSCIPRHSTGGTIKSRTSETDRLSIMQHLLNIHLCI